MQAVLDAPVASGRCQQRGCVRRIAANVLSGICWGIGGSVPSVADPGHGAQAGPLALGVHVGQFRWIGDRSVLPSFQPAVVFAHLFVMYSLAAGPNPAQLLLKPPGARQAVHGRPVVPARARIAAVTADALAMGGGQMPDQVVQG